MTGELLLLARGRGGEALRERLGEPARLREDPYDALDALAGRRYAAVVLRAEDPEFEGLARAARRLQSDGSIFALCDPHDEPRLRPLLGGVLDDYFLDPPTARDLDLMRRASRTADNGPDAPARMLDGLIRAARGVEPLEARLAALVSDLAGTPCRWGDADGNLEDRGLLMYAEPAPRVLGCDGGAELDEAAERRLAAIQELLPALVANARRIESLHRLAITDHLTGACNRRYFYHAVNEKLLLGSQRRFRAMLLLWDMDNFKRYNDTYGHAAGDEILRETATLMKRICREHDIIARIGGDEFAAFFWDEEGPRTVGSEPLSSAEDLAERFRRAIRTHAFPSLGPEARGALSISGGLARFPEDGTSCRTLLRRADEALKQAKREGKNTVRLVGG